MDETFVVLVTAPDAETAARVARTLVEEGLAACGNVVPGLRSIYRWEGKLCDEAEVLLLLKTTRARYVALEARVRALHPYSVPEILALPVAAGSEAYRRWVEDAVRPR
jgi:periplasmic divalent cation tolerance protein